MQAYTLIQSRRKTIALYIIDGTVEVRAPYVASKREIDKFVKSKEKWIKDKLSKSIEQVERRDSFNIDYGARILYRGKEYPVSARVGKYAGFDDGQFYMPPSLSTEQVKSACVQIYRMLAKNVLIEKVQDFTKLMPVMPTAVKINSAKTRWGSCSTKKSLNFSWRLIMADDDVIDYVVVHELAHIIEMNHSKRFWAVVEAVLPDYRERQKRLKQLQHRLSGEDWE
ncbi:MAG: M48 family metallopeptidase [Oscillospiraceae bacterium]|nr:M48 family metallopeptidase [Oscillospiraceae bacterium]